MKATMKTHQQTPSLIAPRKFGLLLALIAVAGLNSACAPLVVGAVVGGSAMVATDRRTSGSQLEDQTIELKVGARIREQLGSSSHVSVNSYNRVALATGEVSSEADRQAVERIVAGVDNVQRVMNETAVMEASSLKSRSNDVWIGSQIKAKFLDAQDLFSNAFDVVVTRGTVYLMGRVTEREAVRATDIARQISGVNKVVRAFEIISEDELARLQPKQKD